MPTKKIFHCKNNILYKKLFIFFLLFTTLWMLPSPVMAGTPEIQFILTSNLSGRFTTSVTRQEIEDPMLIMAQSLVAEQRKNKADLYVDLGNAFYPGLLSRFSYGSVMMDFLEYFNCAATLVASQDLNIGIGNLEFLNREKRTLLLSANIIKNGNPAFTSYFIKEIKGKKIAFIGISAEKGSVNIAEKKLFNITLKEYGPALTTVLEQIENKGVDHIVLLSGASYPDNLNLMETYKNISLCISGGDATGQLYSLKSQRVDIAEGRSIITLTNPDGFYTLTLFPEKNLTVNKLEFNATAHQSSHDARYMEFIKRLTIWKEKYAVEAKSDISDIFSCDIHVDDTRVANLLRDRFKAEIVIMEKNSVTPGTISGKADCLNIFKLIDDEYPIFTYKITGMELINLYHQEKDMVYTGTDGNLVQGCLIEKKRKYLICSTQPVYDKLARNIDREIKYTNSWRTISDEIKADLKSGRVMGSDDYDYLDRRYRKLIDISLSNFYDYSQISRDEDIETPLGKPAETYEKWGIEDKIVFTIYNRYHKFEITPYIYFIRQDENYFQNLLRGTLFYTYNLSPHLKPYHKSQAETVVQEVDHLRPLLFRETLGVFIEAAHVSGKMGMGFEKQTTDPEKDLIGGLETILSAKYDLYKSISYTLDLDTFYSAFFSDHQFRGEISNALYYKLNSFMSFSIKYKWFGYYSFQDHQKYTDSQILFFLDLMASFKKY